MFCGIDNIMWNIPHVHAKYMGNIPYNIVIPT